jgi:hypothetical protein
MQQSGLLNQVQSPLPQIPQVIQLPQPLVNTENQETDSPTVVTPSNQTSSGDSLADLEIAVGSPHVVTSETQQTPSLPAPPAELQTAQDAVKQDENNSSVPPLFPTTVETPSDHPVIFDAPKVASSGDDSSENKDPNAAPPVPPPMSPQFYDADGNNANPFHSQN